MYEKIEKCSVQLLKNVFSPLDHYSDYVFWLRSGDLCQQIYISDSFNKIWQRENHILYDIPLLWLEYLSKNEKNNMMKQFQERHIENYLNLEKNLVFYQIDTPDQTMQFLSDECFKCENPQGIPYVFGISKVMTEQAWEEKKKARALSLDEQGSAFYNQCFELLKKNFGITKIEAQPTSLELLRSYLSNTKNVSFSKRELECLYYLCLGKTAKQTAQKMGISPRTVETFIDNIRCKTTSTNKVEIITHYSHYFKNMPA